MPRLTNAVSCIRARQKATQWLLDQQEKDGSYRDVEPELLGYARSPYLLASTGRAEELSRMLDWIRRNLFDPEKDGYAPSQGNLELQAWLAAGARAGAAFDLSARLTARLLELQGRHTGGLHEAGQSASRLGAAACGGLAFLHCGARRAARAAANFLVVAVKTQKGSKDFYLRFDQHIRPITNFPSGEAREHVIRPGEKSQRHGDLGLAIVLLTAAAAWFGENDYLRAARAYYDVAEHINWRPEGPLETAAMGWGAATLYHVTRRRKYYDAVRKLVNFMVEQQSEEGCWPDSNRSRDEEQPRAALIDRTAYAALLLNEFLREVQ